LEFGTDILVIKDHIFLKFWLDMFIIKNNTFLEFGSDIFVIEDYISLEFWADMFIIVNNIISNYKVCKLQYRVLYWN